MTAFNLDRTMGMAQEEIERLKGFGFAPGLYLHPNCKECNQEFQGDKRAWVCKACAEKLVAMQAESQATEPTEAQMCADLAVAMGTRVWVSRPESVYRWLIRADDYRIGWSPYITAKGVLKPIDWGGSVGFIPNPFRDAAANRALAEWVAAQPDSVWERFDDALMSELFSNAETRPLLEKISKQNDWLSAAEQYRRLYLAAPISLKAKAAWLAMRDAQGIAGGSEK